MFLRLCDFGMIMVWWFESGMIEWLWCDGLEVVFVNVVNVHAYKSKKLQRNVKQKIDWKNHKKISLTFKFFCNISRIPRHGESLKISEDSRKTSSVVIWFAFVYPCVSTEDPEEQKCYFLYYYIKEMYNIKKSSGSSGTSRTYTQLNQNTGEDFLEKVFRFYDSVFRVFSNTSSK